MKVSADQGGCRFVLNVAEKDEQGWDKALFKKYGTCTTTVNLLEIWVGSDSASSGVTSRLGHATIARNHAIMHMYPCNPSP
jgi:hypothetical protein